LDSKRRIFPIEWHIDAHDNDLWQDAYGDPSHTQRQRDYKTAGVGDTYTPEFVVNAEECDSASDALSRIEKALEEPSDVVTTLRLLSDPSDAVLEISFEIEGAPSDVEVTVALVERGLVTEVDGGENEDDTLYSENAVRAHAMAHDSEGIVELKVPGDNVWKDSSIICLVQDPETKQFHGAASMQLKYQ
jgi:hypothetical protein